MIFLYEVINYKLMFKYEVMIWKRDSKIKVNLGNSGC